MHLPQSFAFQVPGWLTAFADTLPPVLPDDATAMGFAVEAAARNVREKTGGPFGALVADAATGAPLALGVNLVVSAGSSVLHAEVCALLLAQRAVGSHDLSLGGTRSTVLYTSAEPCAMCMGAVPWSGVRRMVCAARDEDVRAIGFDEGDKPVRWTEAYTRRGITVVRDVLREPACAVLRAYAQQGGPIY